MSVLWFRPRPKMAIALTLTIGLCLAVACGSAAAPGEEAPPPAQQEPTDGSGQPTAVPEQTEASSEVVGAGQRLTLLVVNIGNGRFDPLLADGEDLKYQRLFNQAMVGGKGGSNLTPGIVTGWEMSPDAKQWIFTVKDDGSIKFHDGTPLTTQDVFFSLDSRGGKEGRQLLDQGVYEPRDYAEFQLLDKDNPIELGPADNQVTVNWIEARPDFAFNWSENAQGPTPMITSEAYFREVGGVDGYERDPMGAGPYKVTDWVLEQRYQFERFNDYFWHPGNGYDEDRRGKFEFITLEVVPEGQSRIAALQSGGADLIEANILMVDQIRNFGGQIAWQNESAYNWVVYVDCWQADMWCYHKEVRQAAELALDRGAITNQLYTPEAVEARGWGHVTPNALGWGENLAPPPMDIERGKELLESVGFRDGKDANGQQVRFTIHTWEAGDLPFLPELAELYKQFWEEAYGWQVEVKVGDASATRQQWNNRQLPGSVLVRTNEARFDGTSVALGGHLNPDIAWRAVKDHREEPWASTTTPIVERGLNVVSPPDARQQAFNEMYDQLADFAYWGYGFHTNLPWGYGSRVANYQPWTLVPYVTAIWTAEPAQ